MAFKKGVCLGWGAHPARSLTLSLCSLSATIATWHLVHHQERMAYPIRKTCDLRIFPIEMILNKYFLEETPGNESKRTIPTDTGNPHSYASPLPATVMGSSRERRMRRKKLYSRKRKEMHCVCWVWCVCLCSAQRLHNLAGSGSGCIVFRSGSRVSSYLLGLLAKIKCSISSSQPDL